MKLWSGQRDSNSRLPPWQGGTLPLSYTRISGALGRNRTTDTRIFSPLLCQLSYQGKIGECDFYGETQEKALLFDYVMYARAGEIADFWDNYKPEIISLQVSRKVDAYVENGEGTV